MNRVVLLALAASCVLATTPADAAPNPMHPQFPVLDAAGAPIVPGGEPSLDRTCGACHDATFIVAHNPHQRPDRSATCADCHLEDGALPTDPAAFEPSGLLKREAIRITVPRDSDCARCHGIIGSGRDPVAVPGDFEAPTGRRTYAMTRDTGAIFASQLESESWLNLADKEARSRPFDVHAQRLVGCTACHFAPNNPARTGLRNTTLDFLINDPRRVPVSQFLHRPDHDLVVASCLSCHDPTKTHAFLPYRARHLETLDCRACHIPELAGPAAQAIDATVVLPGGGPAIVYRGMERTPGEALSSAWQTGFRPFLLPSSDRTTGKKKITPFNLVTRWSWTSGPTAKEVPADLVRKAFLNGDETYAAEVVSALDRNGDGRLDPSEIRLDTPATAEAIRSRLVALGVDSPRISASIRVVPISHGVVGGPAVRRACGTCHADASILSSPIPLASYLPGGVLPDLPDSPSVEIIGRVQHTPGDGLALQRTEPRAFHLFGHSVGSITDRLGLLVFAATALGVTIHAFLRWRTRRRDHAHPAGRRVYLYSAYERIWHWLMAFSVLALMVSGFIVHGGGSPSGDVLAVAVRVHNFFAILMTVNAFLSLFYHLASSAIRQFLPPKDDLVGQVRRQANYYLRGIFLGQPHPTAKTPERKLNPLQQLTYLGLLNVLFPFQVMTGILIWGVSRWPDFAASIGGLSYVAPAHNLGSWLFLSFFVMHVYLTTTGRTVFSNIQAMIDGWEEIEDEH
ncbi:MAG TPA: cytochrome b/b6 domain-containing protein [Myxococcota bacterium]|nr:cytochrome b/b6 domain-containing protein [Myxococcota bacterium]